MNRRSFIAGLLASSAAVPIASSFAADMGLEPVVAMDLGAGESTSVVWWSTPGLSPSWVLADIRRMRDILDWSPVPEDGRAVWYDEAATIDPWQYGLLLSRERNLELKWFTEQFRHTTKSFGKVLNHEPVPDGVFGPGVRAMRMTSNLEANHDDTDHRAGGRNPDAAGDREP